MPLMPADTWPPISSALYWPEPLYATCSMRRPLVLASTTPTRCPMLPTPELAKNALSGLAFTQATYSGQERAPDIGPNAKPAARSPASPLTRRSRCASYGIFE